MLAKNGVPANQESCIYKTLFVFYYNSYSYHYKNKSVNTLMMPPMRKMVLVLDGGNKKPRKLLTPNRLFSLTSRINVYSTRSPNSRTKVCQPHNRMELMYVSKIENERLSHVLLHLSYMGLNGMKRKIKSSFRIELNL